MKMIEPWLRMEEELQTDAASTKGWDFRLHCFQDRTGPKKTTLRTERVRDQNVTLRYVIEQQKFFVFCPFIT